MLDYLQRIQIGLDLGTSIALIVSAVGITWRLIRFNKDAEEQRNKENEKIEAERKEYELRAAKESRDHIKNQTEVLKKSNIDKLRLDGIVKIVSECNEKIRDIFLSVQSGVGIAEVLDSCNDWSQSCKSLILMFGNGKQMNAFDEFELVLRKSITPIDGGTRVNPRAIANALLTLQISFVEDVRSYLEYDESDELTFIEKYLNDK
ncbi:hypothetical protein M8994_05565 [Brucella sp. 21LCYQ03]|nr:hypothetical protein [Brucella sp. 21LCYQ03]